LLRLTVVLAIATAFVELTVRLIVWHTHRRPLGGGTELLWLAPTMNLFWIGSAALSGLLLARLAPRRLPASASLTLAIWPAALALAWLYPKMHPEAGALLALGIAVQAGRVAARRLGTVERALRRTAPVLGAATLIVIGGAVGAKHLRERRAMAELPDARRGPNVVLLILDTVRSYSMSAYGYARETTPHIAALMRESTRFDRAFAPASWTLPSHASMLTGRWSHELSAKLRNPLDDHRPTLAEAMAAAGYATGGFTANHAYLTWEYGLDRGFARFEDYPVNVRTLFASTAIGRRALDYHTFRRIFGFYDSSRRKTAAEVNAGFFDWASGIEGRPFFAMLNYFDAHSPYLPPEPYLTKFGPHGSLRHRTLELRFEEIAPAEIRRKQDQYDGGLAYVDRAVGEVARWLRERRQLDNTIFIVTSDHGEHWGDHERLSHGNSVYRQLLQVPLVVRYPPAVRAGGRVRIPVTLRDIPATIFALAGVENTLGLPGTALTAPPDSGRVTGTRPVLSESSALGVPGAQSLVADGLHYIRLGDGAEELYDLELDSLEEHDLASVPAMRPRMARLRAALASITQGRVLDAPVRPPKN
jgi:arylsulfatase A-like enzyme